MSLYCHQVACPCFHLPCTLILSLRSIRNSVFISAGFLPCLLVGKNSSSSKEAVNCLSWSPFPPRTLPHRILSSSYLSKDKSAFQKPTTVILLFVLFACLSYIQNNFWITYTLLHCPSGIFPKLCLGWGHWYATGVSSSSHWRTCRVLSALLMNCSPVHPGNAVSLLSPELQHSLRRN